MIIEEWYGELKGPGHNPRWTVTKMWVLPDGLIALQFEDRENGRRESHTFVKVRKQADLKLGSVDGPGD